jgi:hypothetical protein
LFFAQLVFTLFLEVVYALDVSSDGRVLITACDQGVIALHAITGLMLWEKEMTGSICSLRIHGGVVVVPVDCNEIVVLDVTLGHLLHTLPSAGDFVYGLCVFDGLT